MMIKMTSTVYCTYHSILSLDDVSNSEIMIGCFQADHWKGEHLVGDVHGPG